MHAHDPRVVHQAQHEDQDDRQQDPVEVLADQDDPDQRQARDQHDHCADEDQGGVQAHEDRRLAELAGHPRFPPEGLADRVGGRQRHHRGGQHGRPEQPEGKEPLGQVPGDRGQGQRRLLRTLDVDPAREDRHRRHDHDEERNGVGPHPAQDRVGTLEPKLLGAEPLVGDGRLQVEEHVRRDGGAHGGHHQQQGRRGERDRWRDDRSTHGTPVGPGHEGAHHVGTEHDRHRQEDALDDPIAGEDDQRPDAGSHDRHGGVAGDAEDLQRGGSTGELGHDVRPVGDQQHDHREEGPADPEVVADQVAESLPRDGAHARRHLEHHHQQHGRDREDPEQREPRLGPEHAVGGDPAGVVAGQSRDQSRPHHPQEGEQPGAVNAEVRQALAERVLRAPDRAGEGEAPRHAATAPRPARRSPGGACATPRPARARARRRRSRSPASDHRRRPPAGPAGCSARSPRRPAPRRGRPPR